MQNDSYHDNFDVAISPKTEWRCNFSDGCQPWLICAKFFSTFYTFRETGILLSLWVVIMDKHVPYFSVAKVKVNTLYYYFCFQMLVTLSIFYKMKNFDQMKNIERVFYTKNQGRRQIFRSTWLTFGNCSSNVYLLAKLKIKNLRCSRIFWHFLEFLRISYDFLGF